MAHWLSRRTEAAKSGGYVGAQARRGAEEGDTGHDAQDQPAAQVH